MKKIWSILMAAMILCLAVSVPSLAEGTPTLELPPPHRPSSRAGNSP